MSATRAQKVRLSLFLLVSGVLLVGTIFSLVGSSLLQQRDTYVVRLDGSTGGLERGSQVRYNGIRVGRVEDVRIAPDNPSQTIIRLSLEQGTPVTEDTIAVLSLQGITGLKVIELSGGGPDSVRLPPGAEIPSGGSDFDLLTERAFSISAKIETLLDNLVEVTRGDNMVHVTAVLAETEQVLRSLREIMEENRADVRAMVQQLRATGVAVHAAVAELDGVLASLRKTLDFISTLIDPRQVERILTLVQRVLGETQQRMGPEELGATIAAVHTLVSDTSRLVGAAEVTLLRTRDDLRRALEELATTTENMSEFTQILVDNPSVLIGGRSERERRLP